MLMDLPGGTGASVLDPARRGTEGFGRTCPPRREEKLRLRLRQRRTARASALTGSPRGNLKRLRPWMDPGGSGTWPGLSGLGLSGLRPWSPPLETARRGRPCFGKAERDGTVGAGSDVGPHYFARPRRLRMGLRWRARLVRFAWKAAFGSTVRGAAAGAGWNPSFGALLGCCPSGRRLRDRAPGPVSPPMASPLPAVGGLPAFSARERVLRGRFVHHLTPGPMFHRPAIFRTSDRARPMAPFGPRGR